MSLMTWINVHGELVWCYWQRKQIPLQICWEIIVKAYSAICTKRSKLNWRENLEKERTIFLDCFDMVYTVNHDFMNYFFSSLVCP
jgi:hypothetical protein